MNFGTLIWNHPRALGFGFFHALASSAGQTFIIALFLPGMKESFGLDDAEIASLYAASTVASALVLWMVGRRIDRVDLVQYSLLSGLFLALACLVTAYATVVPLLAIGFFALRLGGQGLLTHVAVTAVARYFSAGRGKALSLTSMGHSVGEAVLPATVVMLTGTWGWRPALAAAGAFALLLVLGAIVMIRGNSDFRRPRRTVPRRVQPAGDIEVHATSVQGSYSRYFLMNALSFIATPLVITALVFHQALIAEEKGFSLQWFAVSFTAFAVARVASALMVGTWINRLGATRLFPFHLLPLCLGMAILATGTGAWIVPVYWILAGVTSGTAGTLQAAIIAEHVVPERLGQVRGLLAAVTIIASAAGPVLYAWFASWGMTMPTREPASGPRTRCWRRFGSARGCGS
jgi:MFS family permease